MTATQYGLPCMEAKHLSQQPSFLDHLYTEITTSSPKLPDQPPRYYENEIKLLCQYGMQMQHDPTVCARYTLMDRNIYGFFAKIFFEGDQKATELYRETVQSIFADVLPLVHKLKLYYQHPRPVQIAAACGVTDFFPIASTAAYPSFPSLHACVATVIKEVVTSGGYFPKQFKWFKESADDIALSRQYMGQVLPTDISGAVKLAGVIVKDHEFQVKYKV